MELTDLYKRKVMKQGPRRECKDCAYRQWVTFDPRTRFHYYCQKYDKPLTADNKQFTLQGTDMLCEFKEKGINIC